MKRLQRKRSVFYIFFSFCFLKTFNSLCVDETWIRFWEKVVAGSLYKSLKPSISLTKISKKVLTWCINKLKSISFPRESLKNNISYWITHIHEIRKKKQFSKNFGVINFGLKAKFRRINFRSKFRPNFVLPKLFVINVLKNSQNIIVKWSLILINTSFEDKVRVDTFVWKDVEYLSYKGIRGLITNWKEVMIHTWKFTLVSVFHKFW